MSMRLVLYSEVIAVVAKISAAVHLEQNSLISGYNIIIDIISGIVYHHVVMPTHDQYNIVQIKWSLLL